MNIGRQSIGGRRSSMTRSSPELSAYVPERPWNTVIRESPNDWDLWKEELEDKVMDCRQVRALVHKTSGRRHKEEERG